MVLEVIFENDEFIVFNKPAGLSFHSEDGEGFVVKAEKQMGLKLYSVHRLDKMTSGLLMLAKSSASANKITKLFETREIQKFYLAISTRKPKKKQGWIKGDMGSARRGSYMFLKTNDNPAITQFISTSLRTHERFFLIKPHTGKTHQIRVALKSIGSAIAGDMRYAAVNDAKNEERGYLHAYALKFVLDEKEFSFINKPKEGERFISEQSQEVLKLWSKPWELFKQK
ncbi:MAG: TIGR01621 family pseudouridine synthase [Arcobacter sp.]|nr:MAG: TIGR01621 family pseudouridine synthase [Arcobacter sp.]